MSNPLIYFLNTNGVFILVALVLSLLYFGKKNREVFWHALFVFLITFVVVIILKELFDVPRPFEAGKSVPQAGLTFFPSFPSAHAAVAFSVSTIVALHRIKYGIFFLILSTLIAFGRVAANVHYPLDIAFGVLVGVTIALFFDTLHVKGKKIRFPSLTK